MLSIVLACSPGYGCHGGYFLTGKQIKFGPNSETLSPGSQFLSPRSFSTSVCLSDTTLKEAEAAISSRCRSLLWDKGYPEFRLKSD